MSKVILDIAINHTGWAAKIHETNEQWLKRNDKGNIHQPGAWGTVWEDLTELDHEQSQLWIYLADVFITWCERGVDGFRYSKPMAGEGGVWTPEALAGFLANPRGYMKGTKMSFAGLRKAEDRAAVLTYIKAETTPAE